MPVVPKNARFTAVSARLTSIQSGPAIGIPASMTADGASSAMSGPAACQNRASVRGVCANFVGD